MKNGFTLAEVLITITVIGFVGIMTIPELVKNMNDYAFTKSKEVTLAKIKEATNQMKSNDVLSGYATNDAFISEFQKYMKVTKTCDSSNLTNCFPAKFKSSTGKDVDTTTLTTGTKLGDNNIAGNTIALMLANGTSILFSLRDSAKVGTACDRIDPVDNQANTTSCMSFLYDINGYGSPNVIGKDIGEVNVTISECVPIPGLCVATSDLAFSPINEAPYTSDNNYWAGARDACVALGMRLPTLAELVVMNNNRASIPNIDTVYYWAEAHPTLTTHAARSPLLFYNGEYVEKFDAGTSARCVK